MSSRAMQIQAASVRRGFTVTELLVTITILITLVVILVVTVGSVRETARVAQTQSLMTAMSQATNRFRDDVGYLPPILDNDRGLVDPVPVTGAIRDDGSPKYLHDLQGWFSYTSPAEFLLGYGSHLQDGYGGPDWNSIPDGSDEDAIPDGQQRPYPGLRHPGSDGVWSSSAGVNFGGALGSRQPIDDGRIFGPYLELKNEESVGALAWDETTQQWDPGKLDPATNQPLVYLPGENGFNPDAPKVLLDAWGSPIRYYRKSYPAGDIRGTYPASYRVYPRSPNTWTYAPRLSEFIALRPWDIPPGQATNFIFQPDGAGRKWGDYSSPAGSAEGSLVGDPTTTASLQSGDFAFLSAGPDRQIFNWHRTDYADRAGNDGQTFKDWVGHFPGRSADTAWYGTLSSGTHYRGEAWYQAPATEEVNRDNLREIGP